MSTQKGKISNLARLESKKKRTKRELDQVRDIESEMKSNRHAFLLEVQRLRDQHANAFEYDHQEQQLLDLQVASEHAQHDRNALQEQNSMIAQQLQHEAVAKEALRSKVMKLYETLRSNTEDKESIDSIFNEVWQEPGADPGLIENEDTVQ